MDINCGIIDLHFYDETQTQGFSSPSGAAKVGRFGVTLKVLFPT